MSPSTATDAAVTVTPVSSKRDLEEFIRLPWRLYRDNPNWVPPLLMLQRQLFSPKHNPFYQHADVQLFLAHRDGEVVGRISAHVDHEHNRYHQERTGFFGFFETADDPAVAGELLSTAEEWLRKREMERVRGPLSFSTNGESGLLVEGFDSPPVVLMPYSPPHYLPLVENRGYAKVQDLFAWLWGRVSVPAGPARFVDELRATPGVRVRTLDMRRYDEEIRTILDLYNDAWSDNWGFVPGTDAEAKQLSHDLKLILDPHIVPFIEIDGVTAGVALALPNLNEAILDLDGKLFPLGWLKLLWRLKVRRVKTGRVVLLGIRQEFRTRRYAGLAYLLCDETYRQAKKRGYEWAEMSWTLESNKLMNSMIMRAGCEHYKTYRIYEKSL